MFRLSYDYQAADDILAAYQDTARRAPKLTQTAYQRQIRLSVRKLKQRLGDVPNQLPDLPFIWSYNPTKQARARAWYFANKVPKGSKGGRYQRTGQLVKAWDIKVDQADDALLITAANEARGAAYVVGDRQVPSHYATGWYQADEVFKQFSVEITDGLIETWYTLSDPYAGVTR